jgi:protein arginine kinase activator
MLCDACKKNSASIHYFESIDGRSRTLHLCASCAALKGIGVNLSAITFEAFTKLAPEAAIPAKTEPARPKVCVGCGMTYVDFKHNPGHACPACLDTFLTRDELVKRGRTAKAPRRQSGENELTTSEAYALEADPRLAGLKRLLARAVELEEYEEAARLRDLISQAGEGATKS